MTRYIIHSYSIDRHPYVYHIEFRVPILLERYSSNIYIQCTNWHWQKYPSDILQWNGSVNPDVFRMLMMDTNIVFNSPQVHRPVWYIPNGEIDRKLYHVRTGYLRHGYMMNEVVV